MEKNDRTCETKDPVYIYILFYSRLNSSVSLPFSSLLSRRISRISWRGSGRRGRAIDLISRRYSFPRRWTAEAQIAHTYVRSPIPARRSTIETIAYTDRNECCRRCRQRLSTSFDPSFAFGLPVTPDLDRLLSRDD